MTLRMSGESGIESAHLKRQKWIGGNLFTNPAINTTLIQTSSLKAGLYDLSILIYCDVAALFILQLLDTNGSTVLQSQRIRFTMEATRKFDNIIVEVYIDGQKVRLITGEAVVGEVQASFL